MQQKSPLRLILEPLALAVALALLARAFFHIYAIPSRSMEPTLQVGDRILVTPYRPPFFDAEPVRGDVVVFRSPLDPRELVVKRIAGTPGDLVESQIVPSGHYFVAGDNRHDSVDSRQWGPLPRHLIIGRARLVLWSSGEVSNSASAHATSAARAVAGPSGTLRLFEPVR